MPSIAPAPELAGQAPAPRLASGARRSPLAYFVAISMALHLLLLLLGQPLVRRWTEVPGSAGTAGGGSGGGTQGGAEGGGGPAAPAVPWPAGLGVVDVDLEHRQIPNVPFPFPEPLAKPADEMTPEVLPPEPVAEPVPAAPPLEAPTVAGQAPAGSGAASSADLGSGGSGGAGSGSGAGGEGGGGAGGGIGGGSGAGGPTPLGIGDSPPTIQAMTLPDFPKSAKKKSRVPIVLLVHVTASGGVDDVRVERGSADCRECDAAAIASAWKLRFTPGTKGGTPVAMWVRYPVTFGRQ